VAENSKEDYNPLLKDERKKFVYERKMAITQISDPPTKKICTDSKKYVLR
jgi:hypothetical protein